MAQPQVTEYDIKCIHIRTTEELWTRPKNLAGKSHPAYVDAAHWSSTACALQDTYAEIAWADEALFDIR